NKTKPLPILDELIFKINKRIKLLGSSLNSGDEANIINFLHNKIEPLFEHLQNFSISVKNSIDEYKAAIDSKLGFLYRKRKEFEDSVALVNETISAYIDAEEEKAQKMFPHYFEKYKTDGVEHGIYIGNSLSEDGNFNLMYLKNLRLWQIMVLCGVERKVNELKDSLKTPLDTAHLILVQNTPLSIRFHYDEKKFDVDGTYNIRYEVMKKRIDKAEIRGSEERLTQPGKIAIVYSQGSEASEYKEYIEYLQSKNYLTNELEELELNDLQGVHGLKALRVTVNIKTPSQIEKIDQDEIKKAVEKMTGVATNN
ncbi:MAG: GAF domain-containing protein, partial [Ignavibacteria bacterium]